MNADTSPDPVVAPLTDLIVEQDGTTVVISHSTGVCKAVELNDSGALIWSLVDGRRTAAQIADQAVKLWAGDGQNEPAIRTDVAQFLDRLVAEGCVEFMV